jgi:hypothetical protein
MSDLGDRFADDAPKAALVQSDPLVRLQDAVASDAPGDRPARRMLAALRGRTDLLAAVSAVLAAALLAWPLLFPPVVHLPEVAETGDEMATLTLQPLLTNGVAGVPDWSGLFDAYHLETRLRDISIRCTYGLPSDARVDHYLHAPLSAGSTLRVFLADPGTCPRL